tara:strand:- start:1399 stop:1593 length:195 start_codon:yes stop_codon:yes gene_type:complete
MISLSSVGIGSKWATGKLLISPKIYQIIQINKDMEELIGLIWIGYGTSDIKVERPELSKIYFKL